MADLLLAVGLIFTVTLGASDFGDGGFMLMVIGYGIILSLPSLVVLMIFQAVYSRKPHTLREYVNTYIIVIVVINLFYFIVTYLQWDNEAPVMQYFYICSTLAGLLSLYLVQRNIKNGRVEEDTGETGLLDEFNKKNAGN